MVAGSAYARYATTKTLNGTLTISAELGSIALNGATVEEKLIPGVDIDVNREIIITDKSSIPAYVYLVVETNILESHKLSFSPSNEWQEIRRTTADGKTKTVYVYADGAGPVAVDSNMTISVGGVLQVSQYVNVPSSVNLTFTAEMYQTAAGNSAAEVYTNFNN